MNEEKDKKAKYCGVPKIILQLIVKLSICVFSLVDFWSDLLLGIEYAIKGEKVYSSVTFLFTLVPTACGALYIIRYIRRKSELTLVDKILFACCLFLQTHFVVPIWLVEDFYKKKTKVP